MANQAQADATVLALRAVVDVLAVSTVSGPGIVVNPGDDLQAKTNQALSAHKPLYLAPGDFTMTQPWVVQGNLDIIGPGMYQTQVSFDVSDPNARCLQLLDWKGSKLSGFKIRNLQPRDNRVGIALGGNLGGGSRAGFSNFERINVELFHQGINTSLGNGSTSSELHFDTCLLMWCDEGFSNEDYNALNIFFTNLGVGQCGIGVKAGTAGCHIYGGSASNNGIDILYANGGTGSVRGFRSENPGQFIRVQGTYTTIEDCVVQGNATPAERVFIAASTKISNCLFLDGWILIDTSTIGFSMENTHITDPLAPVDTPATMPPWQGLGPGFRYHNEASGGGLRFKTFGNYRVDNVAGAITKVRDGRGYADVFQGVVWQG